jgi:ubiquinone/menaquinone biosynthesis C-methylase UbiE
MPKRTRNVWNVFAPVYRLAMRSSRSLYAAICHKIIPQVRGKRVMELGAGPGIIALEVASATREMIATDSAPQMIAEAKRKKRLITCAFRWRMHGRCHFPTGSSMWSSLPIPFI